MLVEVGAFAHDKFRIDFDLDYSSAMHNAALSGFGVLRFNANPAIPKLMEMWHSDNDYISRCAWIALHSIGSTEVEAVFASALTNDSTYIRAQAVLALGWLPQHTTNVVPAMIRNLSRATLPEKRVIAHALGEMSSHPEESVTALRELLADPDRGVRECAAWSLQLHGPRARAALTELRSCLTDANTNLGANARLAMLRTECEFRDGGIIRGPKAERRIALVFTAHEFAEGGETILNELVRHSGHASFFLTGIFLANRENFPFAERLKQARHYIGPHSYQHLLYCSWENPPATLLRYQDFDWDVGCNESKCSPFLYDESHRSKYFLPAYEHYNRDISAWTRSCFGDLISFTPGTRSNADYTGEADTNFVSSQAIFDSILKREREDPHGLNGFILLFHLGSGPGRKDKFHTRFGELLDVLASKGYQFVRVDELLEPKLEDEKP